MSEIIVRIIDMPTSVRGYTSLDPNGDYNIYINGRMSYSQQILTYNHERRHIARDDFSDKKSILEAEAM